MDAYDIASTSKQMIAAYRRAWKALYPDPVPKVRVTPDGRFIVTSPDGAGDPMHLDHFKGRIGDMRIFAKQKREVA